MRPLASIFRPLGQPSYSTTSDHFLSGDILKMRPNGMSTTKRLPSASNEGPSIKQSVGAPGRLASAQSVRTLRRNSAGIAEKILVSIRRGGVSRYIIYCFHLWWRSRRTIDDIAGGVDCPSTLLRANGSRECAPDDRLREAIQSRARTLDCFVAFASRNDGLAPPNSPPPAPGVPDRANRSARSAASIPECMSRNWC